jgi:hypothetical protein
MRKLFAVFLGGKALRSNTELHDVVFVAGERLEDTYDDLLALWFGSPEGLHIDSWLEIDVVDGQRVTLRPEAPSGGPRLYFVNLGAYRADQFGELHASRILVAVDAAAAKARAKAELLQGLDMVHTDDLYDVDDCLEIGEVAGWHVHLEPSSAAGPLVPHNGYHPLPESVIQRFVRGD